MTDIETQTDFDPILPISSTTTVSQPIQTDLTLLPQNLTDRQIQVDFPQLLLPEFPILVTFSKVKERKDKDPNEFVYEISSLKYFKFYIGVNTTNHIDYNFFERNTAYFIDARHKMAEDDSKDKILMVKILFHNRWIQAYVGKACNQIFVARRFIANNLVKEDTKIEWNESVKDYCGWLFESRADLTFSK